MGARSLHRRGGGGNDQRRAPGRGGGIEVQASGFRSQTAVFEDGELLCPCLYRKGAQRVAARLAELRAMARTGG